MDDPFIAMLFAEDLINYVFAQHGLDWSPQECVRKHRTKIHKTRFNSVIGECVIELMNSNAETIRTCYEDMLEKGVTNREGFRFESMISTVYHLKEGYDPVLYLNLCAMLVGLSLLYFKDGNLMIATGAAHVLAYVINFYIYHLEFNVRNGWFRLAVKAQVVRRSLEKEAEEAESLTEKQI